MSKEEPQSFAFYESFYEAVEALDDDKLALEIYRAIMRYGLYGTKPTKISKVARGFLTAFEYQIDAAKERRKTKQDAGSKGGKRKPASKTASKKSSASKVASKKSSASDSTSKAKQKEVCLQNSKHNVNVNDNGNVNENDNVFLGDADAPKKNKKPYGEFSNVFLTSVEHSNLPYQLGTDWKQQLEKLSAYKKSHPAFVSADDYATLKLWKANETIKHGAKSREPPDPDTIAREKMLDDSLNEDMEAIWRDVEAREKQEKGETNAKKA